MFPSFHSNPYDMNFRFSLEKGSRKYVCPKCGDKKSFTRYIDNCTGEYLGENIGRCDHEISCKYHNPPKQSGFGYLSSSRCQAGLQAKKETSFISFEKFSSTLMSYDSNSFIKGLLSIFNKDKVTNLIERYFIGTISNKVVFWQVDQHMRIRTGKIMSYDPSTLKRVEYINWAHKYFKLNKFNLKQCLFGLNLIRGLDPGTPICIVEAEKTAVIMSAYYPDVIWMAAGALQHLNKDKLLSLVKHKVYLYPDIGAEKTWAKKTIGISNIEIVDWARAIEVDKNVHRGNDLADFPHPVERMPLPGFL